MLANQFGEIQSLFGRSVTVLENRYKDVTLYSGLGGNMSRQGMNFIFVEEERLRRPQCCHHLQERYQPKELPKKSKLHQKRHVGSHLRGRLLILIIRKVNLHHEKNLHNLKEKVLALAFLRFRFLSLSWFQEIMIHRVLCITCQNS